METELYEGAFMLKVLENTAVTFAKSYEDLPRDQILIEGLVLPAFIGVFEHEYEAAQSVRFDVTVDVSPLAPRDEPDAQNIVRYDYIVADIKAHLAKGHVDLVETLAEDIAALCLAYDRAEQVCVAVAKLDAFEEAQAVGVRITRRR
jgi:dihydroneopterin aldolase